jgi:hypothetical protein
MIVRRNTMTEKEGGAQTRWRMNRGSGEILLATQNIQTKPEKGVEKWRN